jgi:hypothetical protein
MPATPGMRRHQTDQCNQLRLLASAPEQSTYELLRLIVLFGQLIPARARETGMPERTVQRKVARFVSTGLRGLHAPNDPAAPDRRTLRLGIRSGSARPLSSGKPRICRLRNCQFLYCSLLRMG